MPKLPFIPTPPLLLTLLLQTEFLQQTHALDQTQNQTNQQNSLKKVTNKKPFTEWLFGPGGWLGPPDDVIDSWNEKRKVNLDDDDDNADFTFRKFWNERPWKNKDCDEENVNAGNKDGVEVIPCFYTRPDEMKLAFQTLSDEEFCPGIKREDRTLDGVELSFFKFVAPNLPGMLFL